MIAEVFCCSGGFAEGLRRAGLQPDIAFDYDTDACDSYERNLGHRPIQIDARDLLRMSQAGWSPGNVDLLICDPPCTPWSRAGKRKGQADERDMLSVTVELIRLWRPRFWLIANVPGLDDGPNWPIVQREIGGLTREHYCVDFQRIDAASVGVPQHRVRPFWYGHLRGTDCIEWPERTHAPLGECGATLPGITARRKPYVTCRQALAHLSPEDLGTPVRLRWRQTAKTGNGPRASHADAPAHVVTTKDSGSDGNVLFDGPNHRPSKPGAPARTITRNTHGDGSLLTNDRHPVNTLDAPSFTVTTKGDGRGAQGACVLAYDGHPISRADEPGHVVPSSQPGNGGAVLEWPWDRPATTVNAQERLAPPGHHEGGSDLSKPNAIKLSEKAATILQGFPSGWHFAGATKKARWSQIGQGMCPPLAEAVGHAIMRAMQSRKRAIGQ